MLMHMTKFQWGNSEWKTFEFYDQFGMAAGSRKHAKMIIQINERIGQIMMLIKRKKERD